MGKKQRTNADIRKTSAARYTGRPHFPRLNFDGSKGLLVHRLQIIQPMETIYDVKYALVASDVIELKAVTEPMLMRDRREVVMNVTKMELNGRFQVGET